MLCVRLYFEALSAGSLRANSRVAIMQFGLARKDKGRDVNTAHSCRLPARKSGLESRQFDDEFVVLDPISQRAHAIHGPVAEVWRAAGDGTWPDLPAEQVEEIVAELTELGLLEDAGPVFEAGISRRLLLKGSAATGVAFVGLATLDVTPAFASTILSVANGGKVTIQANSTTNFTLIGGGGGAGAGTTTGNTSGGAGGSGGDVSGTIQNTGNTAVQLTINLAGSTAGGSGTSHGGHGSGIPVNGGNGGDSQSAGAGGGGAGSSDIATTAGNHILVVAAGGGGGGGAAPVSGKNGGAGASPGNTAGNTSVTGTARMRVIALVRATGAPVAEVAQVGVQGWP